jgi:uncharacterized repeat protein (TIGR03803 family)
MNAFSRLIMMRFVLAGSASLVFGGLAVAQSTPQETLIYLFQGGADGANPNGGLIIDDQGSFYGVTKGGGAANAGTVFRLAAPEKTQTAWRKTTLYSFGSGADGVSPNESLIFDHRGSLYGVTTGGGAAGAGAVFQLSPPEKGQAAWTETILWSFAGGADGAGPLGGLIFDTKGALYGVTAQGGAANAGTVFQLAPPEKRQTAWTKTTLYSFGGGADGADPQGSLIFDHRGSLYGVTYSGGAAGGGTVYQLAPPEMRQTAWTETVLLSFAGGTSGATVGAGPRGGLIFDTKGALYGGTSWQPSSSAWGFGMVYQLSPPAKGQTGWNESVLSWMSVVDGDHASSTGSLIFDTKGNLYGTSLRFGYEPFGGTVYQLSPPTKGQTAWTPTVLHHFSGGNNPLNSGDGAVPSAGLTFGQRGALYGITYYGGLYGSPDGYGTVFQISMP